MASELQGKTIAILAADGVEQVGLERPRQAVQAAGAVTELRVDQAGRDPGRESGHLPVGHLHRGPAGRRGLGGDYDALILPGGAVNPDNLRQHEAAVAFVRDFVNSGKPVGVICHGPWTLSRPALSRAGRPTSYPSVRTDIRNAGGNVDDQGGHHQNITSSRWPDDPGVPCRDRGAVCR